MTTPRSTSRTQIEVELLGLDAAVSRGPVDNLAFLQTERRALGQGVGIVVGLGLVAGAALGFFTSLARRWEEEA